MDNTLPTPDDITLGDLLAEDAYWEMDWYPC